MLRRSRCGLIFSLKYQVGAISLEHKERYDIITDEEWYILAKVVVSHIRPMGLNVLGLPIPPFILL